MLVLFASLSFARDTPEPVGAWRDTVDWARAEDETVRWLADYLAVDTVAPPGNEMDGVRYLTAILDAEGIGHTVIDHGDNRGSLIARLPATRPVEGAAPLCLLSHIDVVPSERENWTVEPLSGEIRDGQVYGRGALDMKGMGIVELGAMVHLKRLGVPLERDLVLLAVADEEVHGLGMKALVNDHWSEIGCSHMINEGGLGIRDALLEGQTLHAISVAEKGTLWTRMIASGNAGHGSTVTEEEAPARLLEAMALLERKYRPKYRIDPAFYELFDHAGRQRGGFTGSVLRSPFLVRLLVKSKLKRIPTTRAAMSNTLHLTGMGGASSVNVVPSEVWAQYDSRLMPGTSPEELLAELQHLTRKLEHIRWEVVDQEPANGSPWDDPFYDAIEHYAAEGRPEAAAGPILSVGFTDSIFARPLGVHAYGYVPFEVSAEEAETMHGHDERVSIDNLREGTRRMLSILLDFAGTDAGPTPELTEALAAWSAVEPASDASGLGAELAARLAVPAKGDAKAVLDRYTRARLDTWLRSAPLPSPEQLGEGGLNAVLTLAGMGDPAFTKRVVEPLGCEVEHPELRSLQAQAGLDVCGNTAEPTPHPPE
ncbi:MAG: M20/M25/M40 family metallo-hydrolase [Myxococcota bacterium]